MADDVPSLIARAQELVRLGRLAEARVVFEQLRDLSPGTAGAHYYCGFALFGLNRYDEAIPCFRQALRLDPNHLAALNDLGMSLTRTGHHRESVDTFERALGLMPASRPAAQNLAIALKNLGREQMERGRYGGAAAQFERALQILPGYRQAAYGLGDALNNLGRPQEALALFEKLSAANPSDAMAYLGIGDARKSVGQFAAARAAYQQAVTLAPMSAVCQRLLAEIERFTDGDPRLAALEDLAKDGEAIPEYERPDLYFALGKAYDDLDRHADAFACFAKANSLKRRQISYDEASHLDELHAIARLFTAEVMVALAGGGDASQRPVFIVGMPRSGTTLVEQILASHPAVFGAGERDILDGILETRPAPFDASLLQPETLRGIGGLYVEQVSALAPQAEHITDKMTGNFRLVGLIRLALPNARIVHVRRDAVDTCWSCYSHDFRHLGFTYDLGELGRDYRAYAEMMEHWRRILPADAMLEIRYEDLIGDFDNQVRRLIAWCGLDWDDRCLSFHQAERPVQTESALQVRQPLYRSAIGRAKPYEPWLGPLRQALGLVAA